MSVNKSYNQPSTSSLPPLDTASSQADRTNAISLSDATPNSFSITTTDPRVDFYFTLLLAQFPFEAREIQRAELSQKPEVLDFLDTLRKEFILSLPINIEKNLVVRGEWIFFTYPSVNRIHAYKGPEGFPIDSKYRQTFQIDTDFYPTRLAADASRIYAFSEDKHRFYSYPPEPQDKTLSYSSPKSVLVGDRLVDITGSGELTTIKISDFNDKEFTIVSLNNFTFNKNLLLVNHSDLLYIANLSGQLAVVDLASYKEIERLDNNLGNDKVPIHAITFGEKGSVYLAGGKYLHLYQWHNKRLIRKLRCELESTHMVFSDGRLFVANVNNKLVWILKSDFQCESKCAYMIPIKGILDPLFLKFFIQPKVYVSEAPKTHALTIPLDSKEMKIQLDPREEHFLAYFKKLLDTCGLSLNAGQLIEKNACFYLDRISKAQFHNGHPEKDKILELAVWGSWYFYTLVDRPGFYIYNWEEGTSFSQLDDAIHEEPGKTLDDALKQKKPFHLGNIDQQNIEADESRIYMVNPMGYLGVYDYKKQQDVIIHTELHGRRCKLAGLSDGRLVTINSEYIGVLHVNTKVLKKITLSPQLKQPLSLGPLKIIIHKDHLVILCSNGLKNVILQFSISKEKCVLSFDYNGYSLIGLDCNSETFVLYTKDFFIQYQFANNIIDTASVQEKKLPREIQLLSLIGDQIFCYTHGSAVYQNLGTYVAIQPVRQNLDSYIVIKGHAVEASGELRSLFPIRGFDAFFLKNFIRKQPQIHVIPGQNLISHPEKALNVRQERIKFLFSRLFLNNAREKKLTPSDLKVSDEMLDFLDSSISHSMYLCSTPSNSSDIKTFGPWSTELKDDSIFMRYANFFTYSIKLVGRASIRQHILHGESIYILKTDFLGVQIDVIDFKTKTVRPPFVSKRNAGWYGVKNFLALDGHLALFFSNGMLEIICIETRKSILYNDSKLQEVASGSLPSQISLKKNENGFTLLAAGNCMLLEAQLAVDGNLTVINIVKIPSNLEKVKILKQTPYGNLLCCQIVPGRNSLLYKILFYKNTQIIFHIATFASVFNILPLPNHIALLEPIFVRNRHGINLSIYDYQGKLYKLIPLKSVETDDLLGNPEALELLLALAEEPVKRQEFEPPPLPPPPPPSDMDALISKDLLPFAEEPVKTQEFEPPPLPPPLPHSDVDALISKDLLPFEEKVDFISEVHSLSASERKEVQAAYLLFLKEFRRYFDSTQNGPQLYNLLHQEGGVFALAYNPTKPVILQTLELIFQSVFKKHKLSKDLQGKMISDAIAYWNIYTIDEVSPFFASAVSCLRDNYLDLLLFGQAGLLTTEFAIRVGRSLLRLKLALARQRIKRSEPKVPNKKIPCFFVHYQNKKPFIKHLLASFNEQGSIYALLEDTGVTASYAKEKFGLKGRRLTASVLEDMKNVLAASEEDLPFLLLEEKELTYQQIGEGKKRKRQGNETEGFVIKRKPSSTPPIDGTIEELPSSSGSSSLAVGEPILAEDRIEEVSFWKAFLQRQCNNITKKTETTPKKRPKLDAILNWRFPEALFGSLPDTTYPLLTYDAKLYQKAGIDHLCRLHEMGIEGILAWWMGLGKTLGAEELFLRQISSGIEKDILIFTLNAVGPQFLKEVRERTRKAIFTMHLATLYHWKEIPLQEQAPRLEKIEAYIKEVIEQRIIKEGESLERLKYGLILLSIFPETERKKALLDRVGISHPKSIQRSLIINSHFNYIFNNRDEQETKTLEGHLRKLLDAQKENEKDLKKALIQQADSLPLEKIINFLSSFLQIDPNFPYRNLKNDPNFPGKNFSQYLALTSYPCDPLHFLSYHFKAGLPPKTDKKPRFIVAAYHEMGKLNAQELAKFAENPFEMFFLDEAHTLGNNEGKGSASAKNKQMKVLIEAIRKQNPSVWIVPCSGTFVRGDLQEFFDLFQLFNPSFFPKDLQTHILTHFNGALSALQDKKGGADEVLLSYGEFLTLNFLYHRLAATAFPTDPAIRQQWNGRIPTKKVSIKKATLAEIGISEKAADKLRYCDATFFNNISTAASKFSQLFAHDRSFQELSLKAIIDRIKKGGVEKDAKKLKHSAMASQLLQKPEFKQAINEKKKIIIFANLQQSFEILQAYIQRMYPKVQVHIYNGKTNYFKRDEILETFKGSSDEAEILLLSHKVGSTGLNFPQVAVSFIIEETFDPFQAKQAEDRIVRVNNIGEKWIYYLRLGENFNIDLWRQAILEKKEALARFLTTPFQSHEKHLELFLGALKAYLRHEYYRTKQSFSLDTIETQVVLLYPKVLHMIGADETVLKKLNPFLARPQVAKKVESKIKETEGAIASSSFTGFKVNEAISLPIEQGSKEKALQAAKRLFPLLKERQDLKKAIFTLSSLMNADPTLRKLIRSKGLSEDLLHETGELYPILRDALKGNPDPTPFFTRIYCYSPKDNAYCLIDAQATASSSVILHIKKNNDEQDTYDLLIPVEYLK